LTGTKIGAGQGVVHERKRTAAEIVLAEIGTILKALADAYHLASQAGMRPGNEEKTRKRRSAKTKKASKTLWRAFIDIARSAANQVFILSSTVI
jgi:hypothetical protein